MAVQTARSIAHRDAGVIRQAERVELFASRLHTRLHERMGLEMEVLDISVLHIDMTYQRTPNPRRVERMGKEYDMVRAGVIDVNRRPDGTYWVIDGQHRLAAATMAGEKEMLCFVSHMQTVEEEAAFFRARGMDRAPLTALDRMKAAWTAGDPFVRAVVRVVERSGYHMGFHRHGSTEMPFAITAATAVLDLAAWPTHNKHDPRLGTPNTERLEQTLRLIKATWPEKPGATDEPVLRAIDLLLRTYGPALDQGRFAEKLGHEAPRAFLADVRGMMTGARHTSRTTYLALALVRAYNHKAVKYRLEPGRLLGESEGTVGEVPLRGTP